jgi:acyl carrier protein
MQNKERVKKVVLDAVEDIDRSLLKNKTVEKTEDITLSGELNSLEMVDFIIALEELIKKEFGKKISLVDEEVDSAASNPFQTIGTLVNHICLQLN